MSLSQQQALDCFASDDLIGMGIEADAVRRQFHPEGVVSYAVSRLFAVRDDAREGVEEDARFAQLADALAEGVTTIRVVVPAFAATSLAEIERTFRALRERFPSLYLESLTAREIVDLAAAEGLDDFDLLQGLREAGLHAITGEVGDLPSERWRSVHALAHKAGLRSTACLPFGGGLASTEFVDHLLALRNVQAETGGFAALSLTVLPGTTGRGEFEEPTAVEYLRALAVARITLDNFENIESSSTQQGLKVAQMALRFGANDAGTIGTTSHDPRSRFTESDLRRVIRDAGFIPAERDGLYRMMFLNN